MYIESNFNVTKKTVVIQIMLYDINNPKTKLEDKFVLKISRLLPNEQKYRRD